MTAGDIPEIKPGVLLAGASGTIGSAVSRALDEASYPQVCIDRATLADGDRLQSVLAENDIDTVISCIASRSGAPKDAQAVDCEANLRLLKAAERADVRQFILLSAICVQRPILAFQHAKLEFERELAASPIDHTIIRPTAFFKSLSGQVQRVARGKPFLIFGDGELTRCKPISDEDLARFMIDCIGREDRTDKILPIGGPGPAISLRDQGEMLFELTGRAPKFKSVPIGLFDAAIRLFSLGARWTDWMAEKHEYARIARYYATESMLLLDPENGEYSADKTPEFGTVTLRDHYKRLLEEGAPQ